MATLYELWKRPDGRSALQDGEPEKHAALLFALLSAIQGGLRQTIHPGYLQIRDDGSLVLQTPPAPDYYWCAPEEFLFPEQSWDSRSLLFTLGLLVSLLLNGKTVYEDGVLLVDLKRRMETTDSLMPPPTLQPEDGIPYLLQSAMHFLTAWDPGKREQGAALLLEALRRYPGTVRVEFVPEDRDEPVEVRTFPVKGTISAYGKGQIVQGEDGVLWYVPEGIDIAFQPGTRTMRLPVRRCTGRETTELLDGFQYRLCLLDEEGNPRPISRLRAKIDTTFRVEATVNEVVLALVEINPRTRRFSVKRVIQRVDTTLLTEDTVMRIAFTFRNRLASLWLPEPMAAQGGEDGRIVFFL